MQPFWSEGPLKNIEEHDIIVVGEHVGSSRAEAYMAGAKEHRVIIAGSREMADYEVAKKAISEALRRPGPRSERPLQGR